MNDESTHKKILLVGTESTCEKAACLEFHKNETLIPFPLLKTEPLSGISFSQNKYDWIIYTSPAAVTHFNALKTKPESAFIAAVGPSTGKTLESLGLKVNFVPSEYNSKCFAEEFLNHLSEPVEVLFPCSQLADNLLENSFANSIISLTRIDLYKPVEIDIKAVPGCDGIVFFSSSAVEAFYNLFGESSVEGKKVAAIGKKAADSFEKLFNRSAIVPANSTAAETIQTLL